MALWIGLVLRYAERVVHPTQGIFFLSLNNHNDWLYFWVLSGEGLGKCFSLVCLSSQFQRQTEGSRPNVQVFLAVCVRAKNTCVKKHICCLPLVEGGNQGAKRIPYPNRPLSANGSTRPLRL